MSEDRLEKALEAIKNEDAKPEELAGAHTRVWEKLENPGKALCAEFQFQLRDYLNGRLDANRRMLMEDHLSRCPHCRTKLAELKGERPADIIPIRRISRWRRWGAWAAVAALIMTAVYLGRSSIDKLLAPRGPRATVASVKGNLYLVPKGLLKAGSTIGEGEVIRTGPGTRVVLRLADGSLMDVNERTELSLHAVLSGKVVHLERGDIIVQAAKQRLGYLRVQTRDSLASVKGTVFAVSAGFRGTLVSVIEGSVAVAQAESEVLLRPGQQAASNSALVSSAQEAVSWSPDAETYIAMLTSLAKIEKQIDGLPSLPLRTQSHLLQYLPSNTVVYGAAPNLSSTVSQVMALVEQQAVENPVFGQWWNSSAGQTLKQLIGSVQTVTYLFGDEIVFGYSLDTSTNGKIPMLLAEVQPGKQAEISSALNALGNQMGRSSLFYNLNDSLMILSDSPQHLQWLSAHLGQGAATPFAAEIASRYQNGASWFLGMDMDSIITRSGVAGNNLVNVQQVKHLFLEQSDDQGAEENAISITFKGPRMGLASFLAGTGSGGAAEYISSDTIAATYVSTREPRQMFEELFTQLARSEPSFRNEMAKEESKAGISLANDIAFALGTESALAIENISITGPVWVAAILVNDPSTLDNAIRRIAELANTASANTGVPRRIIIEQEVVDGRTWTTMKSDQAPLAIVWTYDRGYMVASSDRGTALRALATRNGGSSLIWSPVFQQQLAGSAGLHPAGFAWLNTRGALQNFAAMIPNPMIKKLLSERDPILVVFNASTEQIRAVSRTRLSGLFMDIMLLQGLGQSRQPLSF